MPALTCPEPGCFSSKAVIRPVSSVRTLPYREVSGTGRVMITPSALPRLTVILSRSKNTNESDSILDFNSPLKTAREQFEKEYLMHQLKKNGSNISKTAESIGMERSALHRKLTSLGIENK